MKTYLARLTTTHLDKHNERFALTALESAAEQLTANYITMMAEHDIRHPPIGRVVSAEVVPLDDGEYALEGTCEIWEPGDTADSVTRDGRSIRPRHDGDIPIFEVWHDRTFDSPDLYEEILRLADLSGQPAQEVVKKAVEPISTLAIVAGVFVLGSIAKGFLEALGHDTYNQMKESLRSIASTNKAEEQVIDFLFLIDAGHLIEVDVLLDTPSSADVEDFLAAEFAALDEMVVRAASDEPEMVRLVLEWRNGTLRILYGVRQDGFPLLCATRQALAMKPYASFGGRASRDSDRTE